MFLRKREMREPGTTEREVEPTLIATQCEARSSVKSEPSTIVPVVKTLLSSRRTIVFPEGALPFALLSFVRISAPRAVSHWSTAISNESELAKWSEKTYLARPCSPVRETEKRRIA